MKWITRGKVKADRVACPWIIRRFVDPQAPSATHPVRLDLAPENPVDADGVGDHHRHADARDDKHDAQSDAQPRLDVVKRDGRPEPNAGKSENIHRQKIAPF